MSTPFTVQDILSDIEIELLQGAVTQDELGQSVQNVRRFQNSARGETLDSASARTDFRQIANRQFQINDMLLTLIQETATRLRGLELELRKAERAALRGAGMAPAVLPALPVDVPDLGAEEELAADASADFEFVRHLDALQDAMREDALLLQIEAIPSDLPAIGKALGGLRAMVHSLVVFYVNRLAQKQSEINRLYGASLRDLHQSNRRQQDEIDHLSTQLAAVQERLQRLERRDA
jgi:hypothetical protein